MTIVTLTTDFGTRDGYVGEMKGVIATRAPGARLVDVTHAVPAGDVRAGAWPLGRIWSRFPEGTVHLAVVDPGVGGDRRAVAARANGRWMVGPDNGLATLAAPPGGVDAARRLDPDRVGLAPLSDTFHGRDLFAPAAARLAAGAEPAELGPAVEPGDLVDQDLPAPRSEDGWVVGHVRHVDRFGNLITDLPSDALPEDPVVEIGDHRVRGLSRAFAAVAPGEPALIRGSGGTLEVCVRDGRASEVLGHGRDARVRVRPADRREGAG
mgnify:CR=1 FL=1